MRKDLHAGRGLFFCALFFHAVFWERPCSYGLFRRQPGLACTSCPQNQEFNEIKSRTTPGNPCVCRGGFTNTAAGDAGCVMCKAGQHLDHTNTCQKLCGIGKYSSFAGQTACTSCQNPQVCANMGYTQCVSPPTGFTLQCPGQQRQTQNTDDFSLYKSFSISKI